eukprot:gene20291-7319_t
MNNCTFTITETSRYLRFLRLNKVDKQHAQKLEQQRRNDTARHRKERPRSEKNLEENGTTTGMLLNTGKKGWVLKQTQSDESEKTPPLLLGARTKYDVSLPGQSTGGCKGVTEDEDQ